MPSTVCTDCGNCHFGPCATEETCFIWEPEGKPPNEVLISGSWHLWQTLEKLTREVNENGDVYFKIILTLLAGRYEYKYVVDGQWVWDKSAPVVEDQFGSFNNVVKVYPKKMFVPVGVDSQIKISSGIIIEGLKLIGSWDGWAGEISMSLNFWRCSVAFVPVEPDKEYEFKFKLKKQYLIDEKYPTSINSLNTLNNIIITYAQKEVGSGSAQKKETPTKWKSIKHLSIREFHCRSFEWVTRPRDFQMAYERVQGHSMCCIGEFIYIFGGYCRSEFYNSLTKINSLLTHACTEEALPNGRAFHNMLTYGNKIIIFGGHNKAILQDYYTFNVSEQKWMAVPHISGKYPQKKEKQSCVLHEMLLVFFGGYYCQPDFEYETCYHDISVLDIQNMRWIDQIEVKGEQPTGRFAHTAALIASDMYIFGGTYNATENLNLNDIWRINLLKVNDLSWTELKPKGVRPCPRHGHTMTPLHTYLVVFGGQDDKGQYINDLFIFDSQQCEWFIPITTGEVPRPRYNHAATLTQNDQVLVFGGRTKGQAKNENFYFLRPCEHKVPLNIEQENDQ